MDPPENNRQIYSTRKPLKSVFFWRFCLSVLVSYWLSHSLNCENTPNMEFLEFLVFVLFSGEYSSRETHRNAFDFGTDAHLDTRMSLFDDDGEG